MASLRKVKNEGKVCYRRRVSFSFLPITRFLMNTKDEEADAFLRLKKKRRTTPSKERAPLKGGSPRPCNIPCGTKKRTTETESYTIRKETKQRGRNRETQETSELKRGEGGKGCPGKFDPLHIVDFC